MLLGDMVKEVTTRLGVKSCIPCQARQARMNQAHQNLNQQIKSVWQKFGKPSGPGTSEESS